MRIRAIAMNTFGSFLRNKLLMLVCAIVLCVVLLMMTPMLATKAITNADNAQQMQSMVLGVIAGIMSLVSGFGSLLAAWLAADSVASEMRSGTILAVMARPVQRWEFLIGKYLGVQMLMVIYVFLLMGLSYLLAWMGGEQIQSTWWVLLIYPLVRYAVYSAIAMLLVTVLHPILTIGIVMVIAVIAALAAPSAGPSSYLPDWLRTSLWVALPSTGLLSESRFLAITQANLNATSWLDHFTALIYGLDYAVVFLLLAMWSFRRRALLRD